MGLLAVRETAISAVREVVGLKVIALAARKTRAGST